MKDESHFKIKGGLQIADSVLDLVGATPLVRLKRMGTPGGAEVLAKIEAYNPGGSVKDRPVLGMLRAATDAGKLTPESVIIEPTSGNTGIGLAVMCAALGYRCVLVMPDDMSLERTSLLERFGAEVVLTPAKRGMQGAVQKANDLAETTKNALILRQFENDANPRAHQDTTAQEILQATDGTLDAFVAGIGTGGTITGVGRVLRERIPGIQIVGVEPAASPVLSGGKAGQHRIQGIGAGFVPPLLDRDLCDQIATVSDTDAFDRMNELSRSEGLLVGMSSGAAMHAALDVATRLGRGKRVVVMLPDTGERYLSVRTYFKL